MRPSVVDNLLCCQMVAHEELIVVETINELFSSTIAAYLHVGVAIESGNLFAKASIELPIFKRDDCMMIGLERIEHIGIESRDVARVN